MVTPLKYEVLLTLMFLYFCILLSYMMIITVSSFDKFKGLNVGAVSVLLDHMLKDFEFNFTSGRFCIGGLGP